MGVCPSGSPPNLCSIGLLLCLCFVMVNKLSLSLSLSDQRVSMCMCVWCLVCVCRYVNFSSAIFPGKSPLPLPLIFRLDGCTVEHSPGQFPLEFPPNFQLGIYSQPSHTCVWNNTVIVSIGEQWSFSQRAFSHTALSDCNSLYFFREDGTWSMLEIYKLWRAI